MNTFAALVAIARRRSEMTAAEFDYSLTTTNSRALAALANAGYVLATEHLPAVTPGTGADELARRVAMRDALLDAHRDDIEAMVTAAKAKDYTGWSSASRSPIRYA